MEKNLTNGSVLNNIVLFSLPYLLSYLLQTLYGMADLYIIGQFGRVADSSAVAIGSQVMHMLTVMIVGLAMGATVFIGQSIGAGDRQKAARGIGNTVTIFLAVSLVLTVLLVALVRPITALMSTPADAVPGTHDYLTICFLGIPFLDLEAPIRALDENQTEAVIFLGKVGLGIAPEHLRAGRFDRYDGIFLLLDEEDRFEGEITMIDYGLTEDVSKFVTEISIPVAPATP